MNDLRDSFTFMGDHASLLGDKAFEHLQISALAMLIAIVIAIPLGVWLGHLHRFSFLAINVSNVGRALPSLAVIAIALSFLGVGRTNVIVALVVLAVPPMLTNAYAAVDGVDREVVESARGMGMRPRDVARHAEVPLALPLIFAGIRTAAVYVVATATLGGIFGGGGLGEIIADQPTYRLPGVLAASIWVAALALLTELAFGALQRALTPRGLRLSRAPSLGRPAAQAVSPTKGTAT